MRTAMQIAAEMRLKKDVIREKPPDWSISIVEQRLVGKRGPRTANRELRIAYSGSGSRLAFVVN